MKPFKKSKSLIFNNQNSFFLKLLKLTFKKGQFIRYKSIFNKSIFNMFYFNKNKKNLISYLPYIEYNQIFFILENLILNSNFIFSYFINKIDKSKRKNLKNKKEKYIIL
jgi:hypothetical protein